VDAVETGREAIEKTRENYYALVLVDRKLPDADGVELDKIEDTAPKIRKVIFTGFPSIDNIQEAISLGAHAYVTKPIDPQEIIETVKQQLEEREREFKDRYLTLKTI
jgi:DNA-binding NtrC family response regulator